MTELLLSIYLHGLMVAAILVGIILGYMDAKAFKVSGRATVALVVLAVIWPVWLILLLWEKFK